MKPSERLRSFRKLPKSRVERFLTWSRATPWTSTLIIVGILAAGLASFADSAKKLSDLAAQSFFSKRAEAGFDAITREEVIRVAKLIDGYMLALAAAVSGTGQTPSQEERRKVEVELNSAYLRILYRPVQEETRGVFRSIVALWKKTESATAQTPTRSAALLELDRKRFQRLFVTALSVESAKLLDADDRDTDKD